jgi:hypothetical protein
VGEGCPARTVNRIDLGSDDENLIGPGWYWNEDFGGRTSRWMGGSATLFFTPDVAIQAIQVDGVAFHREREVSFFINDELVDTVTFAPGDWQTVELRVPAGLQQGDERLRLRIESASTDTPAEVLDSTDERELSIAISNLSFSFEG